MNQEEAFQLILHGVNYHGWAMKAVYQAKESKFAGAWESSKKAGNELV